MVFDSDLLWIIEGMQLIDSNQHTRLQSCFDLRNHSGHPGEAPVTEYSLLSFFSDLIEVRMVQRSEDLRFALEPGQSLAVGRHGAGEDLDGDLSLEVGVGGAVDPLPFRPRQSEQRFHTTRSAFLG